MTKLTEREKEKLLHAQGVPEIMSYWAYTVATAPNPTPQQLLTVRELFATPWYQKSRMWIYEDKLVPRPEATYYNLRKHVRNNDSV